MLIRGSRTPHIIDTQNPGVVKIQDLTPDSIQAGNILDGNVTQAKLTPTGATTAATLLNNVKTAAAAAAIGVTTSGVIDITIGSAGAETNTLAIPTFNGQMLSIVAGTVGTGTRAITAASAINQTGNTHMTFASAGDWILLVGITIAGAFAWRVVANDGVALS